MRALWFVLAVGLLAAPAVAAPRPDLTGTWTNSSLTGLQRPRGMDRLVLTEAEAKILAARNPNVAGAAEDGRPTDPKAGLLTGFDRGYNAFWLDPGSTYARVKGERRTSWIVEPADGQLPLTEKAQAELRRTATRPGAPPDGPEALAPADRCLIGSRGSGGPGMLNNIYNNTYEFLLTTGHLAIEIEMMHDVRIIPIFADAARAKAAHRPTGLHPWLGDSVGWWEGDALVVETVHVNPEQGVHPPYPMSPQARITERFRRASPTEIAYDFRVDDPVNYRQPWRTEMVFTATKGPVYEFACHEGNYAMTSLLRAARVAEGR